MSFVRLFSAEDMSMIALELNELKVLDQYPRKHVTAYPGAIGRECDHSLSRCPPLFDLVYYLSFRAETARVPHPSAV
jgi:hypothetical protein